MLLSLLIICALLLSFGNGANDNFKGFATVWGSETLGYRRALTLATLATAAGCVASALLADALVRSFSGKGLVPDSIAGAPGFMTCVAGGAACTILLATRLGFPVSTTHALIGGLVGAGLAQGDVNFGRLAGTFFLPLLASPIMSASLAWLLGRLLRKRAAAVECICITSEQTPAVAASGVATLAQAPAAPRLVLGSAAGCAGNEPLLRVSVPRTLDRLHVASAMAICFARGVNDTPKLAALLVAAQLLNVQYSVLAIAGAMLLGGWLGSRRVAQTMSHRVTRLDHAQGFSANLVTALLVLLASKFGMPVSTTHVSVGAIAGVGAGAKTIDMAVLRSILLSWVLTLPIAAAIAFALGAAIGRY